MPDFADNAKTTVEIGPADMGNVKAIITVNAAAPIDEEDPYEPPYIDLSITLSRDDLTVTSHQDMRTEDVDNLIEALTAARDRAFEWADARSDGSDPENGSVEP